MKNTFQSFKAFNLLLSVLSCTGVYTTFSGVASAAAGSLEFRCEAPISDTIYNWNDVWFQVNGAHEILPNRQYIPEASIISAELSDSDNGQPLSGGIITTSLTDLTERYGAIAKPYTHVTIKDAILNVYTKWNPISPPYQTIDGNNLSFQYYGGSTIFLVPGAGYPEGLGNGRIEVMVLSSGPGSQPHLVDVADESVQMKNLKLIYKISYQGGLFKILRQNNFSFSQWVSPNLTVSCSRVATPLTFTVTNEINFGKVSVGSNGITRPLDFTITSPVSFVPAASVTFNSPEAAADNQSVDLGGGSIYLNRNSDGMAVELGKPVKVDNLNMPFTVTLDARNAKIDNLESTAIINILLQLD
ncbi:hypothetical protein M988_3343 [Hafnia paralvei ATCC 29927]|uniref:hypothetical protein n=1 Tax=Hafnia paralvei TaxID=546367 RepID=UPI0007E48C91|nr:hypothetical protein [Hafnia paralvei]MDU1193357.1 hypothetical protein [Enterobacteriaceae bacterium]MDU1245423.1 hypothetical protein [Enterobacteriaceae bacterium]OAT39021.1 hypothetical protein M988_3343 [Hafnia paralvei ATCC 29927]HCU16842.1 hypothetical protein [Hafnia paralvei]